MSDTNDTITTRPAVIEVSRYVAYGKNQFSPENEIAQLFADLLGQKRLTAENIELIKELGFRVELKGGEL